MHNEMQVMISGDWQRASEALPEIIDMISKPLYIYLKGQFYIGHYHSNECFYHNDKLLGTIAPTRWPALQAINKDDLIWIQISDSTSAMSD